MQKFSLSPINCAVSSVNRSVSPVLIKCRAQSYVTCPLLCQNEQEKRYPSVLHLKLSTSAGIKWPTMSHLPFKYVQLFTQFCAQIICTIKQFVLRQTAQLNWACKDRYRDGFHFPSTVMVRWLTLIGRYVIGIIKLFGGYTKMNVGWSFRACLVLGRVRGGSGKRRVCCKDDYIICTVQD